MDEKYTEFFASLPQDIQEKLKSATSAEEISAILDSSAIPLPDEVMEAIAGGGTSLYTAIGLMAEATRTMLEDGPASQTGRVTAIVEKFQ